MANLFSENFKTAALAQLIPAAGIAVIGSIPLVVTSVYMHAHPDLYKKAPVPAVSTHSASKQLGSLIGGPAPVSVRRTIQPA
jgi:hypothetical protein